MSYNITVNIAKYAIKTTKYAKIVQSKTKLVLTYSIRTRVDDCTYSIVYNYTFSTTLVIR